MKLSILMPVYNEQDRLGEALKQCLAVDYPCEIELVVVDDGSSDRTRRDPRAVRRPPPAEPSTTPATRARAPPSGPRSTSATGDYMVILDADLEYDPNDIPRLLEPVLSGKATVVYGNRTFGGHAAYSFWYVMGNKGVTLAANILFNSYIGDLETCFKLMPVDALPVAGRALAGLRHGGRGHRQAAAPPDPAVRDSRSATPPAPGSRARRSPGGTASRRCGSWPGSGSAGSSTAA